jgi:Fe-S cluster biosynthesis and repair protein YggX
VRTVQCVKLGKELPGLEYPPFGGELGDKIWLSVSEEAWKMFLEQFKMIMNEYRLQGGTDQATNVFMEQANKYFFEGGTEAPPEYKPQ